MDRSRLLAKLKNQAPSRITDGPANQFPGRHRVSTSHVHLPPSLKFTASARCDHLFHAAGHLRFARYVDFEEGTRPSYTRRSSTCFSHHLPWLEPTLLAHHFAGGLQPRLFSSLSIAEYFETHQLSTLPEFTAGLKAFRRRQFFESAQNFKRVCDVIQQPNARQKLKESSHLLPWGCLAVALFRQGAYERAAEVSRQILEELPLEREAAASQSACSSAFRAFAVVVASSAAFECKAQKQESRLKENCDLAADGEEKGDKEALEGKHVAFFPLQTAKLCVSAALDTWKTDSSPNHPEECLSLRELQILTETLAGAATPSNDEKPIYNRVPQVEDGFMFDFLNLVELYNNFILKVYKFLAAALSTGNATGIPEGEFMRCLLPTVESLLNGTSAMVERLEKHRRNGELSHTFRTVSSGETPARERHETKINGENRKGHDFAGVSRRTSPEGKTCAAFNEDEYTEQAAMGTIQVCRGIGASLIQLCATGNGDTPLIGLATGGLKTDVFAMGQSALKKGLTLCKLHTETPCTMAKGGLLANLAASFHQCGEAVVSEGLFRAALNEFGASTGLQAEELTEGATEKLPQPGMHTHTSQAQVGDVAPGPRVAEKTHEKLTTLVSHLPFADRFEYASAILQYSFLLNKWEGREFEAEKLRKTAAKLFPVLQHARSDAARRSVLECCVFSLLWKQPISVATCMSAAAYDNL